MMQPGDVTQLLHEAGEGDSDALVRLMPIVYDELRSRASSYLKRERSNHTLQTTALVHEAYLRLVDQERAGWVDRVHFFALAATCMRRVLVDHARSHASHKRGGQWQRVPLDDVEPALPDADGDLLALDEAIARLAAFDERKARVVELRFFGGLEIEETAQVLGLSPRTVDRDLRVARSWLLRELAKKEAP